MELLYLYIKQYNDIFNNISFNFGADKEVYFDRKHNLLIYDRKQSVKGFYCDNIINISVILGANGAGKSTLLDILGMKRNDRLVYRDSQYYMIYHIDADLYAIEFSNAVFFRYCESIIKNLEIDNVDKDIPYKDCLGFTFQYKNSKIIIKYQLIKPSLEYHQINYDLCYFYLNLTSHSSRIANKDIDESDYMFERNYSYDRLSYEEIFYNLAKSNKRDDIHYKDKKIIIRINDIVERNFEDFYYELEDYFIDSEIDLNVLDFKSDTQNRTVKRNKGYKDSFLKKIKFNAIKLYYFEAISYLIRIDDNKINIDKLKKLLNEESEIGVSLKMDDTIKITNVQEECEKFIKFAKACNFNLDSVLNFTFIRNEHIMQKACLKGNDKEIFTELYDALEKLPIKYFNFEGQIEITPDIEEYSDFKRLFEIIDRNKVFTKFKREYVNRVNDLYDVSISEMSDGEKAYFNILTQIATSLHQCKTGDTALLLIDEPDSKMHPEWARCFVSYMINTINVMKDINVQIILTSHSPFIASDILNQNAYYLIYENGVRTVRNDIKTFANNIFSLFAETFMLKSFYGEFASDRIREVLKDLKEGKDINVEYMKILFDNIGEKILKSKLKQVYNQYSVEKNDKDRLLKRIFEEKDSDKLKKIREILDDKS